MARPERRDVDYFPFFAKRGRTLNILQSKFGLEGIGFFTNLMRFLALTPDHHYCIKDDIDRMNFFAEIGVQDERGIEMIELMIKTEKLDGELWEKHRVIVSEAFLASLKEAYKKRNNEIITIEEIREKFERGCNNRVSGTGNPVSVSSKDTETELSDQYLDDNPQSKVKKSKVKKSKVNIPASPDVSDSSSPQKSEKTKKLPLREREPVNDMERVEKAYLENWDYLYARQLVKAKEPVVNWNKTRALLKNLFEKLEPETIILGLKNGLSDDWVIKTSYSLPVILSAAVLNRLINTNTTQQGQSEKKSLE